MSEARKAAAAPRGSCDNAAHRAAYSGKSTLRCNTPAKTPPRRAATTTPHGAAHSLHPPLQHASENPAPPRSHHPPLQPASGTPLRRAATTLRGAQPPPAAATRQRNFVPPRSHHYPARRSAQPPPSAATYQRQPCPAALEQSKKSSRRTWQEAARGALSAFSPRGLLFAACNRLRLICPICLATLQQNSTVRGGCACGRG